MFYTNTSYESRDFCLRNFFVREKDHYPQWSIKVIYLNINNAKGNHRVGKRVIIK